jgi:hypothetical protein
LPYWPARPSLAVWSDMAERHQFGGNEMSGIRELDHRSGDGIDVTLFWDGGSNDVFVEVADERAGARFRIAVDAANALDAFAHPYAYWTVAGVTPDRFAAPTRS